MTVTELLEGLIIKKKYGPFDKSVKGIAYDSRLVKEGFVFVAVRGFSVDGHAYIEDAMNRGSVAIIAEDAIESTGFRQFVTHRNTAYIEVPDSREALALISSVYYGHPSRRLSLVGITGTNGKTTTSFITKTILETGGGRTGLLGTISYMTGGMAVNAFNTTPESLDLQRYLREMVDNEMRYGVLEVSSHALALKRVKGCFFDVAAFTSFSQDHLDFHHTMDEYFSAKSELFGYLGPAGTAVLNNDDPRIRTLTGRQGFNVVTYGIQAGAMIRAENINEHRLQRAGGGSVPFEVSFDVHTPGSTFSVHSSLIGRFNVYNILCSIGIARALGVKDETIQKGIGDAKPVDGRFESINEGQDFLCIVDYAHTEDALIKLIEEARSITGGRIITVFGCGGNRDRSKRPLMGKAASELSDVVIVTSDNPRFEDPSEIIREILEGIEKENYSSIPDREEAIREAVSTANPGDTVLIAGKGHENYQEVNNVRHHFSDREILRREIKKRLALSG